MTYLNEGNKTVDTKSFDATGTLSDVTIVNRKMSGYQLLVGFNFMISSHISVGPSVVYRNVSYGSQLKDRRDNTLDSYAETNLYSKKEESSLDALISLSFRF